MKGVQVNNERLNEFVTSTIRTDGITVLRLLSDNAGDLAAAAVVYHLWNSFEEKKPSQGYNEDTLEKKPLLR